MGGRGGCDEFWVCDDYSGLIQLLIAPKYAMDGLIVGSLRSSLEDGVRCLDKDMCRVSFDLPEFEYEAE